MDYETLSAFNPHDPPDANKLTKTVADLEQRGLLQYDGRTQRHDLHPVVRGVTAGWMEDEDKQRYGQRVVDHFSTVSHSPYEQAETLEDLRPVLNAVRTWLMLGQFRLAAAGFRGDLAVAIYANVEAHSEALSLLRAFFPKGWEKRPRDLEAADASYIANSAALALDSCGESKEALAALSASLRIELEKEDWNETCTRLGNVARILDGQNLLAKSLRMNEMTLELATEGGGRNELFRSRLFLLGDQARIGEWTEAEATWQLLHQMGRDWPRKLYRPGHAEWRHAQFQSWQETLEEDDLVAAERLTAEGKNRLGIRSLHSLRGAWRLEQGEWALASASFAEAVRMARESGIPDAESETGLALAKHHLGQLVEPQREAERLAQLRQPAHRLLAQLWNALGDPAQANHHALAAYRWAWADGEPYVHRYELTKTTELLQQMNVPIPNLPPYDPAKDEPFPWEADVRAAIEKLRAEKEESE